MRLQVIVIAATALLGACGVDSLGAATTGASAAAQAAKQGIEQKAALETQFKAAADADQKRVEAISDQVDRASQGGDAASGK